MGAPMPKPGNPNAAKCRHCQKPKVKVRGFLLCQRCDAGMQGSLSIRPTWSEHEADE